MIGFRNYIGTTSVVFFFFLNFEWVKTNFLQSISLASSLNFSLLICNVNGSKEFHVPFPL